MSVYDFPDFWLIWKGSGNYGQYHSWAVGPCLYKKGSWRSIWEQAGKYYSSVVSTSFPACTILTEAPSLAPLCCTVTCKPHKLFLPLVVFLSVFCPKETTTYPHTLLNALTTWRHLVVHENFPNKITGPFHRWRNTHSKRQEGLPNIT